MSLFQYSTMLLCNMAESIMAALYLSTMLNVKQSRRFFWFGLFCILSLGSFFFSTFVELDPEYHYLFSILLLCLYSLLWDGTFLRRVFAVIFTLILIVVPLSVLVSLESVIFDEPAGDIFQSAPVSIFNESIVLLLAWAVWKFSSRKKKSSHLSKIQTVLALFYPCIVSIAVFLIARILQTEKNEKLLVLLLLLFTSLLLHIALTSMLDAQNERVLNLFMMNQQIKAEMDKAYAVLEAYREQRKLSHEYANHIAAIGGYIRTHQYKELENYISELTLSTGDNSLVINTNNPPVDAILCQKYSVARRKNLSVSFNLCDLSNVPMRAPDLVIILSNLFNNAIEGTEPVVNGRIQIKVVNSDTEFLISVRNQVPHDIQVQDNLPPASSKGGIENGFGLQNVISVAKKYGAQYLIECQNGWFQVTVLLNKPAFCDIGPAKNDSEDVS